MYQLKSGLALIPWKAFLHGKVCVYCAEMALYRQTPVTFNLLTKKQSGVEPVIDDALGIAPMPTACLARVVKGSLPEEEQPEEP